ncbi:hypothetical protein QU481_04915 [Crenobacter sp. SG2303]|uniref:HEPN domain-containing protein n=1 Tax=Crenobacter oryzisoli TaxID=3056844 RepID=A0ABT7XKB6_9NEIS|nr:MULTISPECIES: hypothetical protein [unclassified Crenobacter]MDN0074231.1 hypothetical protein [Crenobacter sp. SG2303]MDN0082295.1 hypothetical protein [Crenobacter sp. SG2305]
MDEQDFLQRLETRAMAASELDHTAHLYAAWVYRRNYPAREAAARCAYSLSRFAMTHGVAEKYHHTLTMALLAILYRRLDDEPYLLSSWDRFLSANPDLVRNARSVVCEYYSEARLADDDARRAFVQPDLKPLPTGGVLH